MHFKLDFPVSRPSRLVHAQQQMLLMGSCFAENIGDRLTAHKLKTLINPNGILFNPVSILHALLSYGDQKIYDVKDLFQHQGIWYSWQHHGLFSDPDRAVALHKINTAQQTAAHYLQQANPIILTFGSAFVYELKDSREIVANCHKMPQQQFTKRLLSVKEIITAFEKVLNHQAFAGKQFILTVSPVRYVRDGLVENNHSKAILLRAVHELIEQHNNLYYFPTYEIVIDELRDYRFFEKDMVHPNQLAIDYVWERFTETVFDEETKTIIKEVKEITAAKLHRPFHQQSSQHQQFLATYLTKINEFKRKYPFLSMDEEVDYFSQK